MAFDPLSMLPVISIVISLGVLVGGYIAIRTGYSQQAEEIQDRVILALKNENEGLERRLEGVQEEIATLKRVMTSVRYALKRRGLILEVNTDYITLIDEQAKRTYTLPISEIKKEEHSD